MAKYDPERMAAEVMEIIKAEIDSLLENERADLEAKLAELLCHVTGGRFSKTTYSIEEMKRFADDFRQEECEKCEELEQVKRERDAAVEDLKAVVIHETMGACETCKHNTGEECDFELSATVCAQNDRVGWEWRGAPEGER